MSAASSQRAALLGAALALAAACKGAQTETTSDAATAAASATAPATASATASAAPPQAVTGSLKLVGTFTSKVGPVAPPAAAKEKTWTQDPGAKSVGPGKVALTIDRPAGNVRGDVSGALGDLVVSGTFDGKELRANLSPKDPNAEEAMTGYMTLALEGGELDSGGKLQGTLRVAGKDARLVREADLALAKSQ